MRGTFKTRNDLHKIACQSFGPWSVKLNMEHEHPDAILTLTSIYMYDVFHEGQKVGYLYLFPDEESLEIENLQLDKNFQKKGFASGWLKQVAPLLKETGIVLINLEASGVGKKVWPKMGFEKSEKSPNCQLLLKL